MALPARIPTRRLELRRAHEADLIPYCQRIYGDARVMAALPGGQAMELHGAIARARTHLMEHWDVHGFGPWLVVRSADGRIIGHCGLRLWPDTEDVELLYALEPPAWGNGYASEAAAASLGAGFRHLGLQRVIAGVLPDNRPSVALLCRLGMSAWEERPFCGLSLMMYEIERGRWDALRGGAPDPGR